MSLLLLKVIKSYNIIINNLSELHRHPILFLRFFSIPTFFHSLNFLYDWFILFFFIKFYFTNSFLLRTLHLQRKTQTERRAQRQIQTDTESDRHREWQTQRVTDTESDRHRDRHRDRETETDREYVMCYSISWQTLQVLRSDLCCQAFQYRKCAQLNKAAKHFSSGNALSIGI